MTDIGYYWFDGISRNFHHYTYDPAGNLLTDDQGFFNTRYLYDGADQLTGEVGGGTYATPTLGYTYDHNGNRLTQTSGGSQVQGFTYDAHDKLTGGTNETATYDPNGNLKSDTLTGQTFTYDDEDRLTGISGPGAGGAAYTDTFRYNGLGLRVGKTDTTGTYSYLCDGASPGAAVLSDGHAVYTPGLSENRAGAVTYPAFDRIGNLWTQDASPKSQTFYQDFTGFGSLTALGGTNASPFRFGGGLGCQSDADTGLVLMGHRYFDPRLGRFITQDPAGDGDNWYSYADNSPVNEVDPDGLMSAPVPGAWSFGGGTMSDAASAWGQVAEDGSSLRNTWNESHHYFLQQFTDYHNGKGYQLTGEWPLWNQGFMLSSSSVPMQMADRSWRDTLGAVIQGVLIGVTLGHGGVKTGQPWHFPKLPNVTSKKAKKGKTVEEKDSNSGDGSKFSSRKPSLRGLGQELLDGINNVGDSWARGMKNITGSSSYGGFPSFGGGIEIWR